MCKIQLDGGALEISLSPVIPGIREILWQLRIDLDNPSFQGIKSGLLLFQLFVMRFVADLLPSLVGYFFRLEYDCMYMIFFLYIQDSF